MDRVDGQVRVLLLEDIHPGAAARLVKDGYQVETAAGALGEDELVDPMIAPDASTCCVA